VRIRQAFVSKYRGVDVVFPWSQAVVLFGRNDAGKSNILDAIALISGVEGSREDPLGDQDEFDEVAVGTLVELDNPDLKSGFDSTLLAALLQQRHVPPLFPYARGEAASLVDRDREQELWGGTIHLSQFPGSLLTWQVSDSAEESPGREFKIGCVGETYSPVDPVNTVGSLDEVRQVLRERALTDAADALAAAEDRMPGALSAFELLFERCLRSRWLLCTVRDGVLWLPPQIEECGDGEREAAARLEDAFGQEPVPIIDGFVRQLRRGEAWAPPFLRIDGHAFQPWDVVRVAASAERLEERARAVEAFLREVLEERLLDPGGSAADVWLKADDDGRTVINERVRELCARISGHATRIAPGFVTSRYEIRVQPLEQVQWRKHADRRIRLELVGQAAGKSFDLAVVGSGLAVWAAFAIEEATRELERELRAELHQFLEGLRGPTQPDDENAPSKEPRHGAQTRLYILDEPERHLHLQAQAQAARWLAGRIDPETSFLVATHALAFLSLPTNDAEYVLVSRGAGDLTRAEAITRDVWGVLDSRASAAGIGSRAQLLQVARAFLIVEGAHDELVLRHFYGAEFERERIFILPIRGAKNARLLIEAEMLALVDVPLIVLFDEIRAARLVGPERPSRRDIALYSLWEMLQHWPLERKPPHVVEFALPDIYCALPDQCVAQVVSDRGGRFAGWDRLIKQFEADSTGRGFKPFVAVESGLSADTDTTELLNEILERCRSRPSVHLRRAVQEIIDRARAAAGLALAE
jgi:hypothetical protein